MSGRAVPPVVLSVWDATDSSDTSAHQYCHSAPTRVVTYSARGRRGPPPCLRCGNNHNVVRWVAAGTWFCRTTGCRNTWTTRYVPPRHPRPLGAVARLLASPERLRRQQLCRATPLDLEVHYGRLGFACRVCRHFYPADASVVLPAGEDGCDYDDGASTSSTLVSEC